MTNRPGSFENGLRITGIAIAIYLLLFAVLWADMEVYKTQYFRKLREDVQVTILWAFVPITYPLDRLGLLSK